ncbi:MAG: 50S ribosomal protein L9 [Lachnospiraceae bacterium]
MEIILLQDVKALGKKGEKVSVSEGYARNFILPKKLGMEANAKNLNDLKLQKAYEDKMAAEALAKAKELAKELEDKMVVVKIKSGKDGRVFGSVSSKEIAEALKAQHNIDIDKKKMVINDAIKALGNYEVVCKLHKDVTAKLVVKVQEA